jgi:DNA-directed RNA polymerase specialized sigma24 family protein
MPRRKPFPSNTEPCRSDQNDVPANDNSITDFEFETMEVVFQVYYPRLCAYVRPILRICDLRQGYEEDLAAEVLEKFFLQQLGAKFGDLRNRDELWKLLRCIASRAAKDRNRFLSRKKRTAMIVSIDDVEESVDKVNLEIGLEFDEQWQRFEFSIVTDQLLQILHMVLAEVPRKEVAMRLGLHPRTVDRKIRMLAMLWVGKNASEQNDEF